MAWQPPQNLQSQDLTSQFHLLPLIEAAVDAVERGASEQRVSELVKDLTSRFEKCQQLLNENIISKDSKPATLRWQKQKLEEYENQLSKRRDLLAKYKSMVEKATSSRT